MTSASVKSGSWLDKSALLKVLCKKKKKKKKKEKKKEKSFVHMS
jgi:hypothetical protein